MERNTTHILRRGRPQPSAPRKEKELKQDMAKRRTVKSRKPKKKTPTWKKIGKVLDAPPKAAFKGVVASERGMLSLMKKAGIPTGILRRKKKKKKK